MKQLSKMLFASILCTWSQAESITLKTGLESLNFENSKKKDDGKRYLLGADYQTEENLLQVLYSHTDTKTFQPPLTDDLHANKIYLKATHRLDEKQSLNVNFITISDNLMKETDGGNIYGIGYRYGDIALNQYLSDYHHFNVYQTDMKYRYKKAFDDIKTSITVIGKYIHLQDKDSNAFSRNAKENYFTAGLKAHARYGSYHFGAGGFVGERVFAVMFDGFRVQHHAMEFNRTFMLGAGRKFGDLDLTFKYVYQRATEIPIHNENVKVQNLIAALEYRF